MKKILGIGLCLLIGVGVFAEQDAEAASAVAHSVERVVDEGSISTLHEEFVHTYIPIIPPAPSEMFMQPINRLIIFDQSTFNRRFINNLVGEMHPVSGVPVYTVYTMMDASNFDVVLFNGNLLELARISQPKTYRPFLWAETKFGAALTPELMALYNPARMVVEYKLIPVDYVDYHIGALERQAVVEAANVFMAMPSPSKSDGVSIRMAVVPATTALAENEESLMGMAMSSSPPPPDGGTNSPPPTGSGGVSNLVMELAITMPLDCGPYAEIFQKQNLVYAQLWDVALNKVAVTGGVETIWADSASSNATTMFYIVSDTSAGIDDGDGFSELRERYVKGTDPTVFDMVDEDNDTLHDWFEVMYFGDIVSQSGTNDFDADGLLNNQELVLDSNSVTVVSDPTNADTDGDGTDDGTEVGQGGDPSDPTDGGQPPTTNTTTVALFVQDRSPDGLGGGYTMRLSDGNNTYEISSSGQEAVSNTFSVVSGRSYTLTLISGDFVPYTGAYTATVSGNGLVTDDPENILGVHDDNNTEVDLSSPGKTAAVHVMRIQLQEGENEIDNHSTVYISEAAAMPPLQASLLPEGLEGTNTWYCGIVFNRPNRNENTSTNITGDTWSLAAMTGGNCCGGKATLIAGFSGISLTNTFHIRGHNPTEAAVETAIGNIPFFARAIAQHESGTQNNRTYLQFNEVGTLGTNYMENLRYTPNRSSDGIGWGIFQLTNPAPSINEVWSWESNVVAGRNFLTNTCHSLASTWIASQEAQQQADEPSMPLQNYIFTFNGVNFRKGTARTPIDACTIQRYNGASSWVIYWRNTTPTQPGSWMIRTTHRDYVDSVCGQIQ